MSPPKMSNSHVWFSAFKPPIKRLDRVMWSMYVPFFSQMIWPSSASACVNCLHTNVPNKSADLEWYHKHWSHTRSVITFTKEETVVYLVPLAKSRKCIFLGIVKKIHYSWAQTGRNWFLTMQILFCAVFRTVGSERTYPLFLVSFLKKLMSINN